MSYPQTAADWLALATTLGHEFSQDIVQRTRERTSPAAQLQRIKDSGLTNLAIARECGGAGQPWSLVVQTIRELAAADGSVGMLYGYHQLNVINLRRVPQPQRNALLEDIVENRFWLAGVVNPLDDDIIATPDGDGFRLDGRKGFCSGAAFADRLNISARHAQTGARLVALIPAGRPGLSYADDWDYFGLERSDSGSFTLDRVRADAHEIQANDLEDGDDFSAVIRTPVNQSAFTQFYLGNALGALRAAQHYVKEHSRAWVHSKFAEAHQDPLVVSQFGELWIALQGAIALADRAARKVDELLAADEAFTAELRGETAIEVASAKVLAARTALDVTAKVFDAMGARATHNRFAFDRFWRDTRTHSLHDPLVHKVLEVGEYALNGRYPAVRAYT
ncbi:acyl-CoA dehydrogenase family protein [Azomonas macrocytogenes]|uniref:Alkylation response protein AidB-like acyl-CoA dehydrogenase n=1 Tax=Azomonas macrocytogenes TaxID=69962 RepID=A0A839SZQ7_AZOMA|nr:acyl-CoA dehydrogenase family protein [Azomonas macrocytogenes]MBB3102189.1 alkylation response protein AidB-like acyl-CoA dehydrogenase [Azomonas macrocytogenes]